MADSLIIRQATLEDASTMLPLFAQFFQENGFDSAIQRLPLALAAMLNDPNSAIFIAWYRLEVIGVATVTTTSQGLEFNRYAELEDLYVLPDARLKGVGRALIDIVKQWCHEHGCSVLSVVVTPEAQATRNLIAYYQQHGFQESGRLSLFHYLGS